MDSFLFLLDVAKIIVWALIYTVYETNGFQINKKAYVCVCGAILNKKLINKKNHKEVHVSAHGN